MTEKTHKLYINTLISITLAVTLYLIYDGFSYYFTPLEERFYHDKHANLKPSGFAGHGYGIIGTILILIGVFGYMIRKRYKRFSRVGVLKYWLEFHIFLCVLGPILILFHTAFKFGGIVSISFWSMVAVVLSGVIGRFIYKQIPRTIQGRELNIQEIQNIKSQIQENLQSHIVLEENKSKLLNIIEGTTVPSVKKQTITGFFKRFRADQFRIKKIKSGLIDLGIAQKDRKNIIQLTKREYTIQRRIEYLGLMQSLFRYWHVAHLPFAIIMLLIMVVHVIVAVTFGYKWIF
ncbi:MAG: hypothetical protein IPI50_07160 [Saprospiraceae bacterium]|nr:hypothetical protein [Saprospiraceae bacterium]